MAPRKKPRASGIALSKAIENLTDFPDLKQKLALFQDRLGMPLQIAVVGEYNSGKSSFLNAVIGKDLLPVGCLPTTGCITCLRYGETPTIIARYHDGMSKSLRLDEFQNLSSHNHLEPAQQEELQRLKLIEVFFPSQILEKNTFIDTPGLNAPTEADKQVTDQILSESDVIIWVTSAMQVLGATEVNVLRNYDSRYRGKSLCVISQTDTLDNPRKELRALLKHANQVLSHYFSDIVAISARLASAGDDVQMRPFHKSFLNKIVPRSKSIKEQAVIGDAVSVVSAMATDLRANGETLNALLADLNSLKSQVTKVLDDFLAHLTQLTAETSRTFGRLRSELVSQIQSDLTTWTDYEPYTRTIEGIIWDDQVVEYKEIQRWDWPHETRKRADERTRQKSDEIMTNFVEQCHEWLALATEHIETLNEEFLRTHIDLLTHSSRLNSAAQRFMIQACLERFLSLVEGYYWGGVNHGGVYYVGSVLYWDLSTTRPSRSRVEELVSACLPIDRIIELITDLEKLMSEVRDSANLCYQWVHADLTADARSVQGQTKLLEETRDLFKKEVDASGSSVELHQETGKSIKTNIRTGKDERPLDKKDRRGQAVKVADGRGRGVTMNSSFTQNQPAPATLQGKSLELEDFRCSLCGKDPGTNFLSGKRYCNDCWWGARGFGVKTGPQSRVEAVSPPGRPGSQPPRGGPFSCTFCGKHPATLIDGKRYCTNCRPK